MARSVKWLRRQMQYVENTITGKKRMGKDTSFEEVLLKQWGRWLPGGDKYHQLGY